MSFITPFYIWASIQSFLLGCNVLQFKRTNANWFLISFLLLTSINILFQYILIFTEFRDHYPESVFISDTIGLLYGPVLYLYYRQMIYQELSKKAFLHFIPAILYTFYFIVIEMYFKYPFQFDNYIGQPAHVVTLNLILLSSIVYFLFCWLAIRRVRNGSKIIEFKLIYWLEVLLMVFILKTIFNVLTFSLHASINVEIEETLSDIKNVIFIVSNSAIIIGLQFFFNKYPNLVNKTEDDSDEEVDESYDEDVESDNNNQLLVEHSTKAVAKSKKEGFSISEEDALQHIKALDELMESQKLYLDSELTEKGLAKALDVQPYFLSKLLNQHIGKRFNEYVNCLRVESAKKLLISPNAKNYTMFAISVDSGFKSESVFYNNFKKFSGETPKAYQQKYLSS